MHLVTIASEATPFIKTGGLADVVGSLFSILSREHRLTLILPYYRSSPALFPDSAPVGACNVLIGNRSFKAVFRHRQLAENQNLILIEQDLFFHRPGLYGIDGEDYPDNFHRFFFFCNAAAQWLLRHGGDVDAVHCHDWQTGLVPLLLKTGPRNRLPCLFTIHNVSFQGRFPGFCYTLTHLPAQHFQAEGIEFYGDLNFLKGGIRYSQAVSTVSPSYAHEIQTSEYGAGLDGLLRARSNQLHGILNGIDTEIWDPAHDPLISEPYRGDVEVWKKSCRSALRRELNLPDGPEPLIVMIGRLTHQKGIDLVLDAWEHNPPPVQLAVLGTGDPQYLQRLTHLQNQLPGLRFVNRFSEEMAHRFQAGGDFFLMPSRFEPCGLTQMVAQRYGTIPLVTQTGGLRDTVTPIGPGEPATGIAILGSDAAAVSRAIHQALNLYAEPTTLLEMRKRAMARDFSWQQSSQSYNRLFTEITAQAHGKRSPLL